MTWRVLVTGATGFVGSRLVARLKRDHSDWLLDAPPGPETGSPLTLDVSDAESVADRVSSFSPDIIVHLAAMASVTAASKSPRRAFDINFGGTLNITEALRLAGGKGRLLYISSAEVYGRSLLDQGVHDETRLLQPTNPYAASKAAADILVRQACLTNLNGIVVRPFNHIGVGQSLDFLIPSLCHQIASIESNRQPPVLQVGSLDDERDFLHVDDVIDAYAMLIENFDKHRGAVFNIASGHGVRIGDLLDQLLALSTTSIKVEVDPARLRPEGVTRVVGDANAIKAATGWAPRRELFAAILSVLESERQVFANSPG